MAFTATIDLWGQGVQEAILNGHLKLQPAQWVRCGRDNNHAALFAGVSEGGTLYVAHWQGSRSATLRRYHDLRQALAGRAR